MTDTFQCHNCGETKPIPSSGGTGYGIYLGDKVCYDCCAIRDKAQMVTSGKATLYLDGMENIINWPGTLRLPVRNVRRFRHPFTREAYLGEFTGPDGKLWRFKNIGDNQIAHCRRAAERKAA